MSHEVAVEAITLKVVPFQEHSHIITLFSKQHGKICIACKKQKKIKREGFSPLLLVEAEVLMSEKQVWKSFSFEVIHSFARLRTNLETLRHAAGAAQFLANTLPMHAGVDELYNDFHDYLKTLSFFDMPHVASTAFLAKYCALEGVLGTGNNLSSDELDVCEMLVEKPFQELYGTVCEKALLKKLVVVASR